MAIGTAAAIIGSAVLGAGASALGASKNASAIKKASAEQARATETNNALQLQIYNQNRETLNPFVQTGNRATESLNALLYGGPNGGASLEALTQAPGYQFRFGEGMNALNTGYAARGLLNSGAAQKAAIQYGQNFATNEYNNRFNQLASQQGVGLTAAGAQAGVGTNYANQVSANNNVLATNNGNAAIAQANNTNALLGNLAGIGGNALGYLSSFGGGNSLQQRSLSMIARNPGIF